MASRVPVGADLYRMHPASSIEARSDDEDEGEDVQEEEEFDPAAFRDAVGMQFEGEEGLEGVEIQDVLEVEFEEEFDIDGIISGNRKEGGEANFDQDFDDEDENDEDDDFEVQSIFDRIARKKSGGGENSGGGLGSKDAGPAEALQLDDQRPGWNQGDAPINWERLSIQGSQQLMRTTREVTSEKIKRVYEILEKEGASDIVVVRITDKCNFADFMVVATGTSHRKLGQLAEALGFTIRLFIEEHGLAAGDFFTEDFHQEQGWVVVDTADIIIHLQTSEVRDYYDIEKLWAFENTNIQDAMEAGIELLQPTSSSKR
ncbi:MAG: ribosome silencing factor [archaeon]|nr:ribosome silencing factor [archaeon]